MYSIVRCVGDIMELVTGGAGFIGSHLVDALVEQGNKVRVVDNFSSGKEEFLSHHMSSDYFEVINGDLLDREAIMSAMDGIETVHHMAANPDIRLGTEVTDTDLKQGTIATYNVLEAMRLNEVGRISFASSSAIYGEASVMPTPESYGPVMPFPCMGLETSQRVANHGMGRNIRSQGLYPQIRKHSRPERDPWRDIRLHPQTQVGPQ